MKRCLMLAISVAVMACGDGAESGRSAPSCEQTNSCADYGVAVGDGHLGGFDMGEVGSRLDSSMSTLDMSSDRGVIADIDQGDFTMAGDVGVVLDAQP